MRNTRPSTAAEQRGKRTSTDKGVGGVMCKRRTLITKISQTNNKLFFFQFFTFLYLLITLLFSKMMRIAAGLHPPPPTVMERRKCTYLQEQHRHV